VHLNNLNAPVLNVLKTVSEGLVFTAIHWAKRVDPDSWQTQIAATAALPAITRVIRIVI